MISHNDKLEILQIADDVADGDLDIKSALIRIEDILENYIYIAQDRL